MIINLITYNLHYVYNNVYKDFHWQLMNSIYSPSLKTVKSANGRSSQNTALLLIPRAFAASLCKKTHGCIRRTSSVLSQITLAREVCRIWSSCSMVKPVWWSSLSYQKRSPTREFLNCSVIIQVKVKPSTLPGWGRSLIPPANKSMSCTPLAP